ncbi:hypothetical protein N7510_006928 [Penicillium lagena]|uniref:uncharacterized protein n=1 Tax=Penicillium lagena TaxID=94218 RepID=UPI002540FF3F|nr:uncharacterized protein N7510_006928 [Penicillium lagena]KAJ5610209.1 hypothetical protein N7510_006928 [Penicillium lagena]
MLGARAESKGDSWPHAQFMTGPWRPPHLMMSTYGEVNPGKFFISVRNPMVGTAATIYDKDGEMIWQGPHTKTMDFKMQRLFGQDVITYWSGQTGVLGYGYGSVHILDTAYNEIYTITLKDKLVTPDDKDRDSYIDVHEHLITPDNTIIVSAINITQTDTSDREDGHPDTWIIDCLFYEIDIETNKILFTWSALDHRDYLPLKDSKNPKGWMGASRRTAWDAYHMNSVEWANGGFVVSIRFWWSAFYINRNGTMRWQLSGGGPGEGTIENDAHFAWQHDIRIHNETDHNVVVTLFDNHARALGRGSKAESNGIAIDVDLVRMKSTTFRRVNTGASDPVQARTQGSFQLLDYNATGHIFMGYGSMCKFKEYDGDGKVVQAGQFGYIGLAQSFRLLKYPWRAVPHWKPAVVVQPGSEFTTDMSVYMSWNGATEHDNWQIYSIPHINSTIEEAKMLARTPRYGFETHVDLRDVEGHYILVEARQGENVLGTSDAVLVPQRAQVELRS